ncbi:MAG: tRNA pseudouridine(55) synthase TruB [Blautia sp.]|nr:tRNA pseudouridine(55) synthase TruB [Blautia sp.]
MTENEKKVTVKELVTEQLQKKNSPDFEGMLVIRKEAGYTSHDVVARLRRILGMRRIGHTGTLDPMAVGVLPVLLGKATRLTTLLEDRVKTYETVVRLGLTTDTQDISGTVLRESPVMTDREQVMAAAQSFEGDQLQVPPMYSALKVDGRKLYELAREGITVERKARPVTFYRIEMLWCELPLAAFSVTCSKGTYIRTFCHDLGDKLGCGACMQELTRTAVGDFDLSHAFTLSQVEEAAGQGRVGEMIVGLEKVLGEYPGRQTIPEADRLLLNGNSVPFEMVSCSTCEDEKIRLSTSGGKFCGIYRLDENRYCPVKMFI